MPDLPTGWQVWYQDGSTFSSERGDNWRQLSRTGIVAVHFDWRDGRSMLRMSPPFTVPGFDDFTFSGPGLQTDNPRKYLDLKATSDF